MSLIVLKTNVILIRVIGSLMFVSPDAVSTRYIVNEWKKKIAGLAWSYHLWDWCEGQLTWGMDLGQNMENWARPAPEHSHFLSAGFSSLPSMCEMSHKEMGLAERPLSRDYQGQVLAL